MDAGERRGIVLLADLQPEATTTLTSFFPPLEQIEFRGIKDTSTTPPPVTKDDDVAVVLPTGGSAGSSCGSPTPADRFPAGQVLSRGAHGCAHSAHTSARVVVGWPRPAAPPTVARLFVALDYILVLSRGASAACCGARGETSLAAWARETLLERKQASSASARFLTRWNRSATWMAVGAPWRAPSA